MQRIIPMTLVVICISAMLSPTLAADGNAARGQRVFGACAACHSLDPDRSMTGPSLAGVWNRKAGSLPSFARYSPALKSSNVVWNDKTLDEWITDPRHLIPENEMTFDGIKNSQRRADLLAFLKEATQPGQVAQRNAGMVGMRGGGAPDLKKLNPQDGVKEIRHCNDGYWVTTTDGKMRIFWERNLRFKTDSSSKGPENGKPAIFGAGMQGDRASVIFSEPDEISRFIATKC